MDARPDARVLTDLIYASLLGERPWRDFLDALRRILPNGKAMLFFHDAAAGAGAFPLNSGVDADFAAAYGSHFSTINPWMQTAASRPLGRVMSADSMVPREYLKRTEFYSDFLRPQELVSGIGVTILREAHCNFLVSVLSADADDADASRAVETMQALVPHLRRAFGWYRREQGGAVGVFGGNGLHDNLRIGVVRVGAGRKVRSVNACAARMLEERGEASVDPAGRFRCAAPDVTSCIDAALAAWMREGTGAPPRSFLLAGNGALPAMRLTVLAPPRDGDSGFFRGPECTLLLEGLTGDLAFAAEEFAAHYRLTAAEKRVVAGLAAGNTLKEIAASVGTSPGTVRAQLKQIFAKTGLGRQVDLVRHVCLLAGSLVNRPGAGLPSAAPSQSAGRAGDDGCDAGDIPSA